MANKYKFSDKVQPPPVDPVPPSGESLGRKVEGAFLRFMQRVIVWGWEFVANMLVEVFDQSMKILKPGTLRVAGPLFAEWKADPDTPAWFKAFLERAEKEEGEAGAAMVVGGLVMGVLGLAIGTMQPIQRAGSYKVDSKILSYRASPSELASFENRGFMTSAFADVFRHEVGVGDVTWHSLLEATKNLPSISELIVMLWRGQVAEGDFINAVQRLGYDAKYAPAFRELARNIPPMNDLIHFMVREAFNEEVVQKFGYDDDYPAALDPFVAKLGYDPDWGHRYWRAHWTLPSPTQAYEMLHRGVIDQKTLEELLKTADYPSFWRDKLVKISYNPFTRIDIRRMYQAGILKEDEVLKAYTDIGYDKEHAEKLTAFTVKGASEREKDLTRADIVGAYEDGLTDRGAASDALVKMGFDGDEAEAIMKQADFNIAKAARADAIQYAKERYIAKIIDKQVVIADLTKAGLKQASIDRYLLAWDRQIAGEVAIVSKADGRRLALAGIITEDEYRAILVANKYTDQAVTWFIAELQQAAGEQAAGAGA